MESDMGEVIFLLLLAGLDVYYFVETFSDKKPLYDNTGGPAVFPRVILILLLICLAVRLIQIIVGKNRKHFVFMELFQGSTGIFLLAFAAYIFLMKGLGMILDTVLYMGFISHYMIYQRDGTLGTFRSVSIHVAVYVLLAAALYWFFSVILNVASPRGLLGFLDF